MNAHLLRLATLLFLATFPFQFVSGSACFPHLVVLSPKSNEYQSDRAAEMVTLQRELLALLKKHRPLFEDKARRGPFLEIGPFYNPILRVDSTPAGSKIVYMDKDQEALREILALGGRKRSSLWGIQVDLDILSNAGKARALRNEHMKLLRRLDESEKKSYGLVVISSVFNYVEGNKLLEFVSSLQNPGDVIAIHNSQGKGDHALFYDEHLTNGQILQKLQELGYSIIAIEYRPDNNRVYSAMFANNWTSYLNVLAVKTVIEPGQL